MAIVVTGTPGTGKSTYAAKLARDLGYQLLDLTAFIKEKGIAEEFDEETDSLIVDEDTLLSALLPKVVARKEIVVDGHLSHILPKEQVARCIVMKCELKELEKRLQARGYSEEKVRENLDAEIFDVCFNEAVDHGHKPEVIWSSVEPKPQ